MKDPHNLNFKEIKNINKVSAFSNNNLICFITLSQSHKKIKDKLRKKGQNTENILFINGYNLKKKGEINQEKGCYYLKKPFSDKELIKKTINAINHGYNTLIIDSKKVLNNLYDANLFINQISNNTKKNQIIGYIIQ